MGVLPPPPADLPAVSTPSDLGTLPEEWPVLRLGDLFTIQQGKALSPKARARISPRPFLRTANVLWWRIDISTLDVMDFTDGEWHRLVLRPGDLLVCEGGEIGRTAVWHEGLPECGYQNHIHRLRAARRDVDPEFYMYCMQAALLLFNLYGGEGNKTTIPNLSRSRLSAFAVPHPSLPEQRAIAHMLRAIQNAQDATDNRKRALDTLFRTLLHNLMTGAVRVALDTDAGTDAP